MKIMSGYINGYTPPHNLILNPGGCAVPSQSMIYAVQASFCQPPSVVHITTPPATTHVILVQITPLLNATPVVTPADDSTNYGMVFWQISIKEGWPWPW